MNKLLIFPIGFMFLLTMYAVVYTGSTYSGDTENYQSQNGTIVQGESGSVYIPNAGSKSFDIWDSLAGSAMVIIAGALAVGVISGIRILGSGLSEMSQSLVFNAIIFLGIWACLTVFAQDFLFDSIMTKLLWVALTLIYCIGLAIHLNGSAGGD